MKIEEIIEELVSLILMQEKELKELKDRNKRLESYIDIYEALLRGE